ncbi:MAG: phage major capsid protein [Gorillibacterium sp.]|nr:phage major capsid protein [Gorillibacterium sp.]
MDARELAAHIRQYYIPVLVDQVFTATPLFARLRAKNQIIIDSGREIIQPFIMGKLNAGSYEYADVFDVSYVKTDDYLTFQWKGAWVNITVDNWSVAIGNGVEGVIPLLEAKMHNAESTLVDMLSTWICQDTGDSKAWDGLWNGIDDGNTYANYGGITRSPGFQYGAIGNKALNAYVDSTGGTMTLERLRTAMGKATVGSKKPDLILCRQSIYDQIWWLVQPQQRFLSDRHNDLVNVGFEGITFDGAAIVVDNHLPTGVVYGVNTDYVKLIINKDRNFYFTDWQRPVNSDQRIAQILTIGNLIVQSPRLCFKITNLTEY